ncbi:MAG: DUF2877 domain-containing protein [Betaproteobacteria bacterium]|nr:DUF2877 domain-containing protein [Betaproteobacteria bacterium]
MTALANTVPATTPRVLAAGTIALRALANSRGRAEPLADFPDAPYLQAADHIIWVGVRPRSMHPRMVAVALPIASGIAVTFDVTSVVPAPHPGHRLVDAPAFAMRAAALRRRVDLVGAPRGFGHLLVDDTPPFPLDLAAPLVRRFAAALATDDCERIEAAAMPLLGLGSGLTPSGDDLVGGALFARRLLMPCDPAWQHLGERIIHIAPTRTHAISAALLADLIHGATYGVLHALVDALIAAAPWATVIDAAQSLTAIGHSSGWDMLTGFLLALEPPSLIKA